MSDAAAPAAPLPAPAAPAVPAGFASVTEGRGTILQKGNEVFYNPVQVVNRDLSVAVLSYFAAQRAAEGPAPRRHARGGPAAGAPRAPRPAGLRILEGLAASGLRAIRYAKEVDGVGEVVANDLDPAVVEALRRNVDFNGPEASSRVVPSTGDARLVMMANPSGFDAVDLDPYGSPSQLLDSAVQAVDEGGLLLVTATDMAVLCGNNGEACFAKYGVYPLHRPYCHEMALRVLLAAIHVAASRHRRYIVPVLSCSIDFYVRVFVRVYTSAAEVKNGGTKLGYVFQSQGCDSFTWQRMARATVKGSSTKYQPGAGPAVPERCPETGAAHTMGGPFWAEPLHDPAWVKGVLALVRARRARFAAFDRIQGLLTSVSEELPDAPLYFDLHSVCKTLRCSAPRAEVMRSALLNAGFRVSGTHCTPLGFKTDAPWTAIWDIMRCWVAQHPVKPPAEGSAAAGILGRAPELKADFSRAPAAVQYKGKGKVARFLPNPEANWGPKPKHGRTKAPRGEEQQQGKGAAAEGGAQAAGEGPQAEAEEAQPAGEEQAQAQPQPQEDAVMREGGEADGAAAAPPADAPPPPQT
jgi:tRNA (guanine26-N2/guanine27-N2)-dimethyltransferase